MTLSTVARTVGPSGETQLVRSWEAPDPWAALLIVHGIAEHSGRYEEIGALFAKAGVQTRSFDLTGFGGSGGERAFVREWSVYVDEVAAHLESVRLWKHRTVLLGHSLGGLIGLEYALGKPDDLDLLVLTSPALGGGKAWQQALAPLAALVAPHLRLPNLIKGEQLSRDPEVGRAYFSDPFVEPSTTTRLGAELFRAIDRVRGSLDSLAVPTLVMCGGADTVVPPQTSAVLGTLEICDRRVYPHLRHELLQEPEGPDVVSDMVSWIADRLGHSIGA